LISETNVSFYEEFSKKRKNKNDKFLEYGLVKNPFAQFSSENVKEMFANRVPERKKFAELFGQLVDGEINHVFLKAKKGMGKTHLLHYLFLEVLQSHEKIGIAKPVLFKEPADLVSWLKTKNPESEYYLFIDEASLLNPFLPDNYIKQIYKNSKIKTINCWQDSISIGFEDYPKFAISDLTEEYEEINLSNLVKDCEVEILEKRILVNSIKDKANPMLFFDKTFFDELIRISYNNPRLLIRNSSKCFHDGVLKNVKKFTGKQVIEYAKTTGIKTTTQIESEIGSLGVAQKRVLIAILAITASKHKKECELKEIAKLLKITRPAVIQNMTILVEAKIVASRATEGVKKMYSVSKIYNEYLTELYKDEIKTQSQKVFKQINEAIKSID